MTWRFGSFCVLASSSSIGVACAPPQIAQHSVLQGAEHGSRASETVSQENAATSPAIEIDNPNATGLPLAMVHEARDAGSAHEDVRAPRSHRMPICAGVGSLPTAPAKAACCLPDRTAVQKLIQSHNDGYRKCYEAALARASGLQGRFVATFTVDKDGAVRRACEARDEAPADGIDDPEMVRCLVAELTEIRFPELDDVCPAMTINYPMVFKPAD
jgi:hypothetical protein